MTARRRRQGKDHPKHRRWVAEQGCMVCGGDAVPHHLMRPWMGKRGTGMKAHDANCVPLCPRHHQGFDESLHTIGEEAFFFQHFGHVAAGRGKAEQLYLASPYGALEVRGKRKGSG